MRRLRELEYVTTMLREQIADVRGGKRLERYRAWRYVTSPVEMKNGYFEAQVKDDAGQTTARPVLFNGYMTLVEVGTRLPPDELQYLYQAFDAMGVNFIQYAGLGPYAWSYDLKHKVLDRKEGRWIYDPAVVASERVAGTLSLAQKNNIAVDFHLQVENVYNHERDAYGLRPHDTGFLHYQINDPLAREG
jgi:NADH:ubiquinone oxidoreductase subunit